MLLEEQKNLGKKLFYHHKSFYHIPNRTFEKSQLDV